MEVQQQEKQVENNQQNIKDIETTAPGKLRVIKRNGKVVAFEDDKIKVAITKAFLATESGNIAYRRNTRSGRASINEIRRIRCSKILHFIQS